MERLYFTINEGAARAANDANSFSDYKEGSATKLYKDQVDMVYDTVQKIKQQKPRQYEKAIRMADRYAMRLAVYFNNYYNNEASCPSVLISGGSNFPTKKKEKQNSRRESLMQEYENIQGYAEKIERLLYHEQPILSKEEDAIDRLEEKLQTMQDTQEKMKQTNAYFRMTGTIDGCPYITTKEIEQIKACADLMSQYDGKTNCIFRSWQLSNNAANIRRTKQRIETLKKEKQAGDIESKNQFCRVVENKEIMRLQLFFDGKPEPQVRDILKKNGFKWAPSAEAWQRQLTDNARYALGRVLKELEAIEA